MISFISSFKLVIREATSKAHTANLHRQPDPNIFLSMTPYVAAVFTVNPYGIKTL